MRTHTVVHLLRRFFGRIEIIDDDQPTAVSTPNNICGILFARLSLGDSLPVVDFSGNEWFVLIKFYRVGWVGGVEPPSYIRTIEWDRLRSVQKLSTWLNVAFAPSCTIQHSNYNLFRPLTFICWKFSAVDCPKSDGRLLKNRCVCLLTSFGCDAINANAIMNEVNAYRMLPFEAIPPMENPDVAMTRWWVKSKLKVKSRTSAVRFGSNRVERVLTFRTVFPFVRMWLSSLLSSFVLVIVVVMYFVCWFYRWKGFSISLKWALIFAFSQMN